MEKETLNYGIPLGIPLPSGDYSHYYWSFNNWVLGDWSKGKGPVKNLAKFVAFQFPFRIPGIIIFLGTFFNGFFFQAWVNISNWVLTGS